MPRQLTPPVPCTSSQIQWKLNLRRLYSSSPPPVLRYSVLFSPIMTSDDGLVPLWCTCEKYVSETRSPPLGLHRRARGSAVMEAEQVLDQVTNGIPSWCPLTQQ